MGRIVKCEGRFSELREFLFNEAVPAVLDGRLDVNEADLNDIWDLIGEQDVWKPYDMKDPYFKFINPAADDGIRNEPVMNKFSLVPLFPSTYSLDPDLHYGYLVGQGNTNQRVLERLPIMAERGRRIVNDDKDLSGRDIVVCGDIPVDLRGYIIEGDVGVGSIADGGIKGGGTRSDSPYLLKVYQVVEGERGLVSLIGFWAQDNMMLVSQMQSNKNGKFPEGVPFGVANLCIAEKVARGLQFDGIMCYTAQNHPMLKEHPENEKRFKKDLVMHWDTSAKKLGYNGGRSDYVHEKMFNVTPEGK